MDNHIILILIISLILVNTIFISGYFINNKFNEQKEFYEDKLLISDEIINEKEINLSLTHKKIENLEGEITDLNKDLMIKDQELWDKDEEIEDLEDDYDDLKDEFEDKIINLRPPKVLGNMTIGEVRNLLKNHTTDMIIITDSYLSLTSVEEAKKFNKEVKVYTLEYGEDFDCDEFAFALMGYWNLIEKEFAFGIAFGGGHVFNVMVDNEGQVWVIEPQYQEGFTKIEDVMNNNKYYPLRYLIM